MYMSRRHALSSGDEWGPSYLEKLVEMKDGAPERRGEQKKDASTPLG